MSAKTEELCVFAAATVGSLMLFGQQPSWTHIVVYLGMAAIARVVRVLMAEF